MPDPEDILDLSESPESGSAHGEPGQSPGGRPYLRLWFRCAGQYARAYKNPDGTAYHGRCPTCGQTIRFTVGEGGTDKRFFEVSC